MAQSTQQVMNNSSFLIHSREIKEENLVMNLGYFLYSPQKPMLCTHNIGNVVYPQHRFL